MKFIESEYIIFGDLYLMYKPAHSPVAAIMSYLGYSTKECLLLYDLKKYSLHTAGVAL
jgi:hypothetical protein